jgi:hypothetical protein
MATFGEILAAFKGNEEAENIVAIIEDEELQNNMIAWKSIRIRYRTPSDCAAQDLVERWEWLWGQIEYDVNSFGIVAGAKTQDAGRLLLRLKGLRLIYPDGTIHTLARQYLQTIIMTKIRQATPRSKSPSSPTVQQASK